MILYSRSIYIKENDAESNLAYYVTLDCYIRQKKREKKRDFNRYLILKYFFCNHSSFQGYLS